MPIVYKAFQASEAWQREAVKCEAARLKAAFSAQSLLLGLRHHDG
jgi:hypothetical protein